MALSELRYGRYEQLRRIAQEIHRRAAAGEHYVSVLDGRTFEEKTRIRTPNGPGMQIFSPEASTDISVRPSIRRPTSLRLPTIRLSDAFSRPVPFGGAVLNGAGECTGFITADEWAKRSGEWLPNEADETFMKSLMHAVYEWVTRRLRARRLAAYMLVRAVR